MAMNAKTLLKSSAFMMMLAMVVAFRRFAISSKYSWIKSENVMFRLEVA